MVGRILSINSRWSQKEKLKLHGSAYEIQIKHTLYPSSNQKLEPENSWLEDASFLGGDQLILVLSLFVSLFVYTVTILQDCGEVEFAEGRMARMINPVVWTTYFM